MTTNLAADIRNLSEVVHEEGIVVSRDGAALVVRTSSGTYDARRAASCLLAPAKGDTVLIALSARGSVWVLSVLDRAEEGGATRLEVDGDLEVRVGQGRFTVAAQHGLGLVSGDDLEMVAGSFKLHAVDAAVVFDRLTALGKHVRSELGKVKLIASTFDSVLDRFSQRVQASYRTVEKLDKVKAGQIDYAADRTTSIRGQNTLMTAKQLVKVDGEQIHFG